MHILGPQPQRWYIVLSPVCAMGIIIQSTMTGCRAAALPPIFIVRHEGVTEGRGNITPASHVP